MLAAPGKALDLEVARLLAEPGPEVPPYSTDDEASNDLVERLKRAGIFTAWERVGPLFYCMLSIEISASRERIATGTGSTRPLALCLAVRNLPEEALLTRLRVKPKA